MDFLSGKKTYIAAIIMILMGVAAFFGINVPGVEQADAGQLIMNGLSFFFVRMGLAKATTS